MVWLIINACRFVGGKIAAAFRSGDDKEGEKKGEKEASGGQCMLKRSKSSEKTATTPGFDAPPPYQEKDPGPPAVAVSGWR